jgi:hypothetical protein
MAEIFRMSTYDTLITTNTIEIAILLTQIWELYKKFRLAQKFK